MRILNGSKKKLKLKLSAFRASQNSHQHLKQHETTGGPQRGSTYAHFHSAYQLPPERTTAMLLWLLARNLNYSCIWGKDECKWRNNLNSCCSSTWRRSKARLKPQATGEELCQSHHPSCFRRWDRKVVCCWVFSPMKKAAAYLCPLSVDKVHLSQQSSSNSLIWLGHRLHKGIIES